MPLLAGQRLTGLPTPDVQLEKRGERSVKVACRPKTVIKDDRSGVPIYPCARGGTFMLPKTMQKATNTHMQAQGQIFGFVGAIVIAKQWLTSCASPRRKPLTDFGTPASRTRRSM
jgi:hypothetical protein